MGWKTELFYKSYNSDGKRKYKRNSRKLWATVSWILLLVWFAILLALIGIGIWLVKENQIEYPWGTLTAITGTLIGNAQVAVGWYTWSKKIDNGSEGISEEDTF